MNLKRSPLPSLRVKLALRSLWPCFLSLTNTEIVLRFALRRRRHSESHFARSEEAWDVRRAYLRILAYT